MKTPISTLLITLVSATSLPAALTITANVIVPNGTASGGNGSSGTPGTNISQLGITSGTITASTSSGAVTLPVTTYTVTGVNLTSVGGTASESFSFTVGYNGTTDGVTAAAPIFSGFGNVGVGTGGQVNGAETLTATVTLTSTSFANLSLTGFTLARAGGVGAGETGTFAWTGGSFGISSGGNTSTNSVTGNSFTLTAGSGSTINIEGFNVAFSAVPEPTSASLLALGAVALLRRRRTA